MILKMDMILFHCCQLKSCSHICSSPLQTPSFYWKEREKMRDLWRMWREDGLRMAHVENRKPITPLRSAIRQNVFICFTCKYTVTLYCKLYFRHDRFHKHTGWTFILTNCTLGLQKYTETHSLWWWMFVSFKTKSYWVNLMKTCPGNILQLQTYKYLYFAWRK